MEMAWGKSVETALRFLLSLLRKNWYISVVCQTFTMLYQLSFLIAIEVKAAWTWSWPGTLTYCRCKECVGLFLHCLIRFYCVVFKHRANLFFIGVLDTQRRKNAPVSFTLCLSSLNNQRTLVKFLRQIQTSLKIYGYLTCRSACVPALWKCRCGVPQHLRSVCGRAT